MGMPTKTELMLPLLKLVARGEISMSDATRKLASDYGLSEAEQSERLSGGKRRFDDRASWARVYLRQAGLLDLPRRGVLKITPAGKKLLAENPRVIDRKILEQYPEFRAFLERSQSKGRFVTPKLDVVTVPPSDGHADDQPTDRETSLHTEVQYMLLKLGSELGLQVWVARNDKSRVANGHRLDEIDGMLPELPLHFDQVTNKTIELIDVLWFSGKSIVSAFEIESTTSIYSGLLRMSDLLAMQPNLSIRLFLVAPAERRTKVSQEINRPTFSRFSPPIHEVCRFLAIESLKEAIARAGDLTPHLKPEFLDTVAESCSLSEEAFTRVTRSSRPKIREESPSRTSLRRN